MPRYLLHANVPADIYLGFDWTAALWCLESLLTFQLAGATSQSAGGPSSSRPRCRPYMKSEDVFTLLGLSALALPLLHLTAPHLAAALGRTCLYKVSGCSWKGDEPPMRASWQLFTGAFNQMIATSWGRRFCSEGHSKLTAAAKLNARL